VSAFESSVERFIEQRKTEQRAAAEQDEATQALSNMDAVYEMYRVYQRYLYMMSEPDYIAQWEALPVSALPKDSEFDMARLYLQMRHSLAPFGYKNLAAFSAAINRFVVAFRENATLIGLELLDKYEHTLVEQNQLFQGGKNVENLFNNLAPARATFARADFKARQADVTADVSKKDVEEGKAQVAAQADTSPLLASQDFPTEKIGRAPDVAGVAGTLQKYIADHVEMVHNTRDRLGHNHELVFDLNLLVDQAKARQGIAPNSIWAKILEDHVAPTIEDIEKNVALAVIGLALGLASGGSLLAAAGSFGLSSYLAIQQYEEYATKSDAFGAQLLATEPSLGWVVLSIVGVVADFAAVTKVLQIKGVLPALREFQAATNPEAVATLESKLGAVQQDIRDAIMARARLEARAKLGWQSLIPKDALLSSFGAAWVADNLARGVYSIVLNLRRGINSFNKWALTREAADLIGDINKLKPEQVVQVRTLYQQAVKDAQRIATHGQSVGMTEVEIDTFVQGWAQRGGEGGVDALLRDMSRRQVVIDRVTQSGKVTRSTLPRGHVGGVRIDLPGGASITFLPLDEAGRAQGVVARLTRETLAQNTGAFATGKNIPGRRVGFQDRGHLLANVLGGPDIPQNLAPLVYNINRGAMAQAEIAIHEGIKNGGEAIVTVTPIYPAGRTSLDPSSFLMSVRWKDGTQKVFQFKNP
jgi:hypothetical protein